MNWNEDNTETQKITAYSSDTSFLKDYGPNPFVFNIDNATMQNTNYRTTLWTDEHMQLTLMSINPGEDIGLEMHPNVDQFLRIESGKGYVKMGAKKDNLDHNATVYENCAIIVPAGMWHNVINTGTVPIKLYSIYAPPKHPFDTVQKIRPEAVEEHEDEHED